MDRVAPFFDSQCTYAVDIGVGLYTWSVVKSSQMATSLCDSIAKRPYQHRPPYVRAIILPILFVIQ